MLGTMSEISMDLIGNVFGGSVAGNFVAKIIGGSGPTGIMETGSGLGPDTLHPADYRAAYGWDVV